MTDKKKGKEKELESIDAEQVGSIEAVPGLVDSPAEVDAEPIPPPAPIAEAPVVPSPPSGPKWSILILTQPDRSAFLQRLQAVLRPQICEGVEIVTTLFDARYDLGQNRQRMIEAAKGEYVSFVDDDDLVADNYVSKIFPLLDGVDYIGFRVQMFADGVKQKITYHSLKYGGWSEDDKAWYRDISHLNPIRRELAVKASLAGGHGEDRRWADELRAQRIVNTEHFIDETMYLYYFRSNKPTSAQVVAPVQTHSQGSVVRKGCPKCGSVATGMAGGMRHCNQCGHRF